MARFDRGLALAALLSGSLILGAAAPAAGQAPPPNMPDRREIERRVREALPKVLDASPEATIEVAGVARLTYKQVPTDPKKIAEILGQQMQGGLPPGVDIDQYIGMFQNEIQQFLNEALANIGKFEALVTLKARTREIAVGNYAFGVGFEGESPVAIVLTPLGPDGEPVEGEEPIAVRLQSRRGDPAPQVEVAFGEPRKQKAGDEEFEFRLAVMRFLAKSPKIERDK